MPSGGAATEADQASILWATNDAGVTWREVWRLDPSSPEFVGVLREGLHVALSFRNPTTGWLGIRYLAESRLYRTDDSGRTWRLVRLPISPLLMNVVARTPDGAAILITSNGYGSHATAITSQDGGDHWESPRQLPDALGGIPFGIAFLDHDHWLYAYGDDVFITKDAGQTWSSFIPSVPPGHRLATEVKFADRLHGWAGGGDVMLRSQDGGRSWALAGPP